MSKRNPEIRLLMKILAVAGFIVLLVILGGYVFLRVKAPHLLEFSEGIQEIRIEVELDSLANARFYPGMEGCENLALDPAGYGFFVTALNGSVYRLDGPGKDSIRIVKSIQAGSTVTGICRVSDTLLAVVVNLNSAEEWKSTGGAVFLMNDKLEMVEQLTANFPSANGICADSEGHLYFASSNFNFLSPEGAIFRLEKDTNGHYSSPKPYIQDIGLANGLFYDARQDRVFFSNTVGGVFSVLAGQKDFRAEYLKIRFLEACDDLCTDQSGNLWMTDPGYSSVKVFNPGTGKLVRFVIKGIGQTSSCRIRNENGKEIIYLAELKRDQKPTSEVFDGRGVIRIPASDLWRLVENSPGR